jgi:hypothetical protein
METLKSQLIDTLKQELENTFYEDPMPAPEGKMKHINELNHMVRIRKAEFKSLLDPEFDDEPAEVKDFMIASFNKEADELLSEYLKKFEN